MNNIKKYIKNIWTIMPMHTKKEKFYLNELKKHLNEYLDDHPQCSYDDIVHNLESLKILLWITYKTVMKIILLKEWN